LQKVQTLADDGAAKGQARPERIDLAADDSVKGGNNARRAEFELIAAGLGFQVA